MNQFNDMSPKVFGEIARIEKKTFSTLGMHPDPKIISRGDIWSHIIISSNL